MVREVPLSFPLGYGSPDEPPPAAPPVACSSANRGSHTNAGRGSLLSEAGGLWTFPSFLGGPFHVSPQTLLHPKKERLSRGARLLLPYWATKQVVINPVVDEGTAAGAGSAFTRGSVDFVRETLNLEPETLNL